MALIDTHTFIWFMYDDSKLSNNALSRIKSDKEVYVSIASLWEIAIKMQLFLNMMLKRFGNVIWREHIF